MEKRPRPPGEDRATPNFSSSLGPVAMEVNAAWYTLAAWTRVSKKKKTGHDSLVTHNQRRNAFYPHGCQIYCSMVSLYLRLMCMGKQAVLPNKISDKI